MDFNLFRHQAHVISTFWEYPEITYTFMIGGFGCGKSTTGVYYVLMLLSQYQGQYINIGIGGVTIKLLRETFLKDLFAIMEQSGMKYKHNQQTGVIEVGTITLIYLAMSNPEDIFAHNFNGFIGDELDEIAADRVFEINVAVRERCRKVLPPCPRLPQGRDPPIVYLTTAQGMKGTYSLIEEFRKAKIPYIKIRGKTEDNTSLSKAQLRELRQLYTPDEARAFLDGEFMNLAKGKVYPEYEPKRHLYHRFSIQETENVYWGQDFNAGYNCGVGLVVHGDVIYVINVQHFDVIGDAPRYLRTNYPLNRLFFIPDATGKEIMGGFMKQFYQESVTVVRNKVNPSVSERIFAVNYLLREGRMAIFDDLEQVKSTLLLRDFDKHGNPSKGEGPKALDHVADSLEYAVWHVIHTYQEFDDVLDLMSRRPDLRRSEDDNAEKHPVCEKKVHETLAKEPDPEYTGLIEPQPEPVIITEAVEPTTESRRDRIRRKLYEYTQ